MAAALTKVYATPIADQSTTTGTGTLTLTGTSGIGAKSAVAIASTGDVATMFIWNPVTGDWEITSGAITISAGVATFARTTVIKSTNGGSAINFPAGTVYLTTNIPPTILNSAIGQALLSGW